MAINSKRGAAQKNYYLEQSKQHSRLAAAAVFEIQGNTAQRQWKYWRIKQKIQNDLIHDMRHNQDCNQE